MSSHLSNVPKAVQIFIQKGLQHFGETMKRLILGVVAFVTALVGAFETTPHARAEVTQCTEITSLPTTIDSGGVYCLKQNRGTNITSGNAITITANNVTIELNGFVLGGLSAGENTEATAIGAFGRRNISVRNGIVRGFQFGISLQGGELTSSGHVIEDLTIERSRSNGITMGGANIQIRNNRIVGTGRNSNTNSGILLRNAVDTIVQNNTITGVDATTAPNATSNTAQGIFLFDTRRVHILNNNISNLISQSGVTDGGINGNQGDNTGTVVSGNIINNVGVISDSDFGISFSTSLGRISVCRNNVVVNFPSAVNCSVDEDNSEN